MFALQGSYQGNNNFHYINQEMKLDYFGYRFKDRNTISKDNLMEDLKLSLSNETESNHDRKYEE